MVVFRVVGLAMLFAFVAPLAAAAPRDDPPAPRELRRFGWTPETNDSDCLGDVDRKPALCAIETRAACFLRLDRAFCQLSNVDYDLVQYKTGGKVSDNIRETERTYQVITEKILTDADIPDWARNLKPEPMTVFPVDASWQAGDKLMQLQWYWCRPTDACFYGAGTGRRKGEGCPKTNCGREPSPSTYVLRYHDFRWHVIFDSPGPLSDYAPGGAYYEKTQKAK